MDKNRKVIKTGNSLALTIPNKIIKSFDIKEGDLAQYKISSSKTSTYKAQESGNLKPQTLLLKQKQSISVLLLH